MNHGRHMAQTPAVRLDLPALLSRPPLHEPDEEPLRWRGLCIRLRRHRSPRAVGKVIVFQGCGTPSSKVSMAWGAPLSKAGFETLILPMPRYDDTALTVDGQPMVYGDWVALAGHVIARERARDGRPIVLHGLSAGGMLAYHAAALDSQVRGVVGMSFLDMGSAQVRPRVSLNVLAQRLGERAGRGSADACDGLRFLMSCVSYRSAVAPEAFDVCPVLLTQAGEDELTPLRLNRAFIDRLGRVSVQVVELAGAGHFPVRQPGLDQMRDAVKDFVRACFHGEPST